jgi:hypothetical protein
MIASRSTAGSRGEIGCGVAPSSHAASADWTNSIPFGIAIVTHDPSPTPRSVNTTATRSTEATSSPRVSVVSPTVSDGRSGDAAACRRTASKNGVVGMSGNIEDQFLAWSRPPCEARPMNLDDLATATCVDPADVRVVLAWVEDGEAISDDNIPVPVAAAVHHVLNPDSERTVLPLYYKQLGP